MSHFISTREAIDLLKRATCSATVIKHCMTVSNLATRLALQLKNRGVKVDVELVKIGALLHDIGRSRTHGIRHAVVGVEIARSFDLPEPIVRIIERHIGSGIPANEAANLGLPKKDFIPETLEEKIVAFADNLIEGNREISFDEACQKFSNELGGSHAMLDRFKQIRAELQKLGSNY